MGPECKLNLFLFTQKAIVRKVINSPRIKNNEVITCRWLFSEKINGDECCDKGDNKKNDKPLCSVAHVIDLLKVKFFY